MQIAKLLPRLLPILGLILASLFAEAQSQFLTESYGQTYIQKSLGGVCTVIDPVDAMLPCHPALLAFPAKGHLGAQIHFGNNHSQLDYIDELIDGEWNPQFRRDLFESRRPLFAEAHTEVQYRRSKWSLAVVPYHGRIQSKFRNYAYPEADVLALNERSLQLQLASYLESNLHFGLRLRAVWRDLYIDRVSLFDTLVEEPDFSGDSQNAFYLEPGLLYQREGDPWRLRFSGFLTEVGYISKKYEGFDASPTLNLGLGIAPELTYGTLSTGLNLRLAAGEPELENGLEWAMAYELGVAVASILVGKDSYTLGLLARHFGIEGGVLFVDRMIGNKKNGEDVIDESVQAHLGVRF